MSFMDKMRAALARLMAGRYGADELSMALMIAGVACSILGSLTQTAAKAGGIDQIKELLTEGRITGKDRLYKGQNVPMAPEIGIQCRHFTAQLVQDIPAQISHDRYIGALEAVD